MWWSFTTPSTTVGLTTGSGHRGQLTASLLIVAAFDSRPAVSHLRTIRAAAVAIADGRARRELGGRWDGAGS